MMRILLSLLLRTPLIDRFGLGKLLRRTEAPDLIEVGDADGFC